MDEDSHGYLSKSDPDDSSYFAPLTDDYILEVYIGGDAYGSNYTHYELNSFNAAGFLLDTRHKYVFESESDAKAYEERRYGFNKDSHHRSGNVLYEYDRDLNNPKFDARYRSWGDTKYFYLENLGVEWYVDCHYTSDRMDNGQYSGAVYISKPYTRENFYMDANDYIRWVQKVGYGYKSKINDRFYTRIRQLFAGNFAINYSVQDGDDEKAMSASEIRVEGATVKGIYCICPDRTTYYYITEWTFTDDECAVTEYVYKVDDPFKSDLSLDNYKSRTPEATYTDTIDMTVPYDIGY